MAEQTKYVLDESRLPEAWYNIMADLPWLRPHRSIQAPASRLAPAISRRSSPWR